MWKEYIYKNIESIEANKMRRFNTNLLNIAQFIGELESGGVAQYLSNTKDTSFSELIQSAEEVKSVELLELLNLTSFVFPKGCVPYDPNEVFDILDVILEGSNSEVFDKITDKYNQLSPAIDIALDKYIARNIKMGSKNR